MSFALQILYVVTDESEPEIYTVTLGSVSFLLVFTWFTSGLCL